MTKHSRAAYAETADYEGCVAISKTFLDPTFKCIRSVTYQINYAMKNLTVLSYYGYDSKTNRIVWAFRGSVDTQYLYEALVTLLEDPVPFPTAPQALMNPFFMAGTQGLTAKLGADYGWLKQQMRAYPSAQVFVTGHSLGGAMASIAATDLAIKKIVTPVLYTFGQPRTGDSTFAQLTAKNVPRSYRVVNANDPVPHLPLCKKTCTGCNYGNTCTKDYACCSLNQSYVHHTNEFWFPKGEYSNSVMCGYSECLASGEDPSCSNKYALSELFDLEAHSAYWNALAGYCHAAPLGAQPSYISVDPNASVIPRHFLVLGIVLGVLAVGLLLAGAVYCFRRRRANKLITEQMDLMESFTTAA